MLAPAIALFFLFAPTTSDSAASRQIAAPCRLVEDRAVQYFEEHDFYTITKTEADEIIVDLGSHKNASTPSGKPLSLNRFSVRKYTLPRHLSPLKAYENFRAEGHLRLVKGTGGSCNATLRFEISAYEYVWSLGMIDGGYPSKFISNGHWNAFTSIQLPISLVLENRHPQLPPPNQHDWHRPSLALRLACHSRRESAFSPPPKPPSSFI